jgi:hypothetical protein
LQTFESGAFLRTKSFCAISSQSSPDEKFIVVFEFFITEGLGLYKNRAQHFWLLFQRSFRVERPAPLAK